MISYLNLPKILNYKEILNLGIGDVYNSIHPGFNAYLIKNRKILSEIKNIIHSIPIISEERTIVWLQRIDSRFNNYIHQDPRDFAISYLLETGGENVITTMYDNDNITDSKKIDPHKWHIINTKDLHSVSGITEIRIAISISVGKNINSHLLEWCNSL